MSASGHSLKGIPLKLPNGNVPKDLGNIEIVDEKERGEKNKQYRLFI